jgi:hypothetical protein
MDVSQSIGRPYNNLCCVAETYQYTPRLAAYSSPKTCSTFCYNGHFCLANTLNLLVSPTQLMAYQCNGSTATMACIIYKHPE